MSYADNNNDGIIQTDDTNSEIVEESNYYPFGLKHKGYNNVTSSLGNASAQKFGFGGKELNEELGLEWHDFDARNYDASLGRWMNLDPLAEDMRRHSPYNYAFNSPLRFTDPDGMKPEDVILLLDRKGAGGKGHMAMLYQDGNGDWFYFSQGAQERTVSMFSGGDVNGGVTNKKLTVGEAVEKKDKDGNSVLDKDGKPVMEMVNRSATESEALGIVKTYGSYEETAKIKTSKTEDSNIAKAANDVGSNHANRTSKYNLFTNNCVDACQDAVQNKTKIKLPTDYSPVPNSYFDKLKENLIRINQTQSTRNQPKRKKTKKHNIYPTWNKM